MGFLSDIIADSRRPSGAVPPGVGEATDRADGLVPGPSGAKLYWRPSGFVNDMPPAMELPAALNREEETGVFGDTSGVVPSRMAASPTRVPDQGRQAPATSRVREVGGVQSGADSSSDLREVESPSPPQSVVSDNGRAVSVTEEGSSSMGRPGGFTQGNALASHGEAATEQRDRETAVDPDSSQATVTAPVGVRWVAASVDVESLDRTEAVQAGQSSPTRMSGATSLATQEGVSKAVRSESGDVEVSTASTVEGSSAGNHSATHSAASSQSESGESASALRGHAVDYSVPTSATGKDRSFGVMVPSSISKPEGTSAAQGRWNVRGEVSIGSAPVNQVSRQADRASIRAGLSTPPAPIVPAPSDPEGCGGEPKRASVRPHLPPQAEGDGVAGRGDARPSETATTPARIALGLAEVFSAPGGSHRPSPDGRGSRTAERSVPPEPRVQIGQVDVIVTAPEPPRRATDSATKSSISLSSRLYLRNL